MNRNNDANKFVCPNDRQLSLRAKLNTGWCSARTEPPLTSSERARIAEVVRRAEKLDEIEARRVGRLVARLEGLRRVTRGPVWKCCAICGEKGSFLSPLKSCSYCYNTACSRCLANLNSNGRVRFLCSVCSETREMWKKSGAWFYKGLPKFVLPEKRIGSSLAARRCSENRLTTSLQEIPCSSSGEGLVRSDSSDMEITSISSVSRPSICQYPTPPDFTRQTSCADSYYSAAQSDSQTDSMYDINSLHHGISALSLSRTESYGQKLNVSGLKRSNSKGSAYSIRSFAKKEIAKPKSPERSVLPKSIPDTGLGTIEIRLNYNSESKTLACSVVRARGLPGMDMTGMADPFCRIEILPRDGASNSLRTKTVLKTRNPEFNETLNFYGISDADIHNKKLDIKIMDDDRYGFDVMGRATINLKDNIKVNGTNTIRLALNPDSESQDDQPKPKMLLSLSYNTKKRALMVGINRCTNLPAMDTNGYSDPFIKLHLDPDPYHKKFKTSIKWRNLNPVYNEEFTFETRPTELTRQSLTLTVWDKDYGKPDDFLGSLVLGAGSKGKRLKHWLDCIRFPDHRHEQWHALTDTYI